MDKVILRSKITGSEVVVSFQLLLSNTLYDFGANTTTLSRAILDSASELMGVLSFEIDAEFMFNSLDRHGGLHDGIMFVVDLSTLKVIRHGKMNSFKEKLCTT